MPASYLHQAVARAVVGDTPLALAGAEGPDPLFYSYHRYKNLISPFALGSYLHKACTGDFLAALVFIASSSDRFDYALGFLTHYATDTTFHPYVYAHSYTPGGKYSPNLHCTLEHAMDTWLYREEGHATGTPRHMAGIAALAPNDLSSIAFMFASAVLCIDQDKRVPMEYIEQALKDSVLMTRLLYSPRGIKYAALGALATPLGLRKTLHAHMAPTKLPQGDFLNEAHAAWESPFAPGERRESVPDLLEAAKARASEFVAAARSYQKKEIDDLKLKEILGNMRYDSALPCDE